MSTGVDQPRSRTGFSWSVSRSRLLAECPRAYYYRYYLAPAGHLPDASPEAREAELLKRCKNRWAWAGIAVHEVVAEILDAIQEGGWISSEEAERRLTERMRADWRASRRGLYREDRKAAALVEHEYRERVPDKSWQSLYQSSLRCLRNFYGMEVLGELRSIAPDDWLSVECLESFDFEGVRVWLALDLAYRRPSEHISIVDWKTGKTKSSDYRTQLVCYGIYAGDRWARAGEPIRLDLAYLYRSKIDSVELEDGDVDEGLAYMRGSIAEMRDRLADPDRNVAREADFEPAPEPRKCNRCSFRRLCERRGVFAAPPPPRRAAAAP